MNNKSAIIQQTIIPDIDFRNLVPYSKLDFIHVFHFESTLNSLQSKNFFYYWLKKQ